MLSLNESTDQNYIPVRYECTTCRIESVTSLSCDFWGMYIWSLDVSALIRQVYDQ